MTTAPDSYDLNRFVEAQEASYAQALAELRAGRKRAHWIWYVLPQIHGLGMSGMSVRYAITSLAEARAYLAHPLLGARLRECVAAINGHRDGGDGPDAEEILGGIDAQKFRSCLTLFIEAGGEEGLFGEALRRYYGGEADQATLEVLARDNGRGA
ncbi:MAG TPA: DUF1810 domain-containing protein [Burkholderiales bacterium]|nr:DUF1810 domain-containing protein [Burkholderiales bacterium]